MTNDVRPETAESPSDGAFRLRAREWLAANAPRRERSDRLDFSESDERDVISRLKEFQPKLHDAGFVGITWPTEYGGQGLTSTEQQIFAEEAEGFDLLSGPLLVGLGMCGPTILTHGTDRQKERYLRPMLRAEELWCQMFSEPGAGSDVASLRTSATLDGDEWILNGQKVWTTGAQYCDYGIVLARTDFDLPKHRGLTMFILDMHAPGVTVKPLRQMNGSAGFNEVFFDDVRIPAENRLSEVNEGWRAAVTTLMNERVAVGAGGWGGGMSGMAARLIKAAQSRGLNQDPVIRGQLADLYTREAVLGYVGLRIKGALRAGKVPGAEGSIAKLAGAELVKVAASLGMQLAGTAGTAWEVDDRCGGDWANFMLMSPALSIGGGTNEIQKNIIAERVLGLHKEPEVDRNIAFRDVMTSPKR